MERHSFSKVEVLSAVVIAVLFLVSAYFTRTHLADIEQFIGACGTLFGVVVYFCIAVFATVIAPISATPLIPLASTLWGPVPSALISILAWTVGAVIAFSVARRFGYAWVQRFVGAQKLQRYIELIPEKNLFFTVVLMRIVLPVDLLSYALGLFSKMSLTSYTIATILGVTPFAFVFTFTAQLPLWLQVLTLASLGIALYFSYTKMRENFIRTTRSTETPSK